MALKRIVIVGRPNVGKSTLFNRLAGKRRALIHDMPGMTRDRLTEVVSLDDGRRYELTDTGGLEYGDSPMSAYANEIRAQARRALHEADFIIFVVDGAAGVLPEDRDIANDLRPEAAKTVVVRDSKRYLIIDTAGIRRKGKTTDEAEKLAVISARKAIERCEIALVMIDGVEGVTAQDATVAGYADEEGRAALLVVNKWDVGDHEQDDAKKFEEQIRFNLKFLAYAPV